MHLYWIISKIYKSQARQNQNLAIYIKLSSEKFQTFWVKRHFMKVSILIYQYMERILSQEESQSKIINWLIKVNNTFIEIKMIFQLLIMHLIWKKLWNSLFKNIIILQFMMKKARHMFFKWLKLFSSQYL